MADKDGNQLAKDYHVGVKAEQKPFHVGQTFQDFQAGYGKHRHAGL